HSTNGAACEPGRFDSIQLELSVGPPRTITAPRIPKENPMTHARKPVLTGGCQCGAVRYALYAEPTNPHVCHCRMCQKAFGSYFAPFAGVPLGDFAWVTGTPGVFRSSQAAERGFCRDCGTPLSFRFVDKDRISVA